MTKYYFESKSTGNRVEVSESEYRSECKSLIDSDNYNFKQVSHLVFRYNGCDCETTLYVEEADMPFRKDCDVKMPEIKHILVCEGYSYEDDEGTFEEVKDNYDWEKCMSACGDEYGNEKITLEIDRTDLPEDLLERHEKNIEEEYL